MRGKSVLVLPLVLSLCMTVSTSNAALVGLWKFDEGSGNKAYDSAGSNHGTIYGASWTVGKFGTALYFDGYYDYVRIPDCDSLDITGDLTVAAWIKTSQEDPYGIIYSNVLEIHPHDGYSLRLNSWPEEISGGIRFFLQGSSACSNTKVNTGIWKHVAVTLSGTTATIYIDGVFDNSGTVNVPKVNDVDQVIGASYTPYYFFHGLIDDVRVYNHALSADEVQALLIPEPTSVVMLGLGGVFLALRGKRR